MIHAMTLKQGASIGSEEGTKFNSIVKEGPMQLSEGEHTKKRKQVQNP